MTDEELQQMFDEITSGIEFEVEGVDPLDVSALSTFDLTRRMTSLRSTLLTRGQYIHPRDDECRQLHSELAACKIELARRTRER